MIKKDLKLAWIVIKDVASNRDGNRDSNRDGVWLFPKRIEYAFGKEGLPVLFAVNILAPYILTCLMHKPKRLIDISSGMHLQGDPDFGKLPGQTHNGHGHITCSDIKLHDLILFMAVALKRPGVYANAIDPGWVPTKMGGAGAPDSLEKGFQTHVWLAASNDREACVRSYYFHHKRRAHHLPAANDTAVQEKFLSIREQLTSLRLFMI
jgi:Dehydrogenases with different specificities (related to short-chain alcohol dehydrogenases)